MTLVDAGSVLASVQASISGKKVSRGSLPLDLGSLVDALRDLAAEIAGPDVLDDMRWFDGAPDGMANEWHLPLIAREDVTVVLGRLSKKRQKRVDVQISLDMAFGASWGASDILLVSGDGDLVPAVECAVGFGATVHLLVLEGRDGCGCNRVAGELLNAVQHVHAVPLRRLSKHARLERHRYT